MKSIVEEKLISFKELEQKIFRYVCELGCEIIQAMLESYDAELSGAAPIWIVFELKNSHPI